MNVLVTSSRMPFALDIVRKLAEQGHTVFAADAYDAAPGSHSRYLAGHFTYASPDQDPPRFVVDVERIVADQGISLLVPAFEEAFFLSTAHERLSARTRLYCERFPVLARLHDKSAFQRLAQELDLPTPQTVVARSPRELQAAIERFPRYFARAAFSRGGVALLTNSGPLAGRVPVADCRPTERSPWLVQEFVDGPMVCSYSTLHDGKVTAHCCYRAPRQWRHSTAIQFESIDGGPSLEVARRLGERFGYTGQMSLDFVASDDRMWLIECNPRTTDGALLMEPAELAGGLVEGARELAMVPPGRMVELDFAVFAQMFSDGVREMPHSIHDLLHVRGADAGWRDRLPLLYSFLALIHHERLSHREHKALFEAMADDMCWDGAPIAGMGQADAAALAQLEAERGGGA